MPNDIRLQEGLHPVDENLRPLKVDGKATAIETAQQGDGARISGNLEVTGNIIGTRLVADAEFEDIICSTITASGNIDAGSNSVTANGGLIVDNITIDGAELDVSSGEFKIDVADSLELDIEGDITLDVGTGDKLFMAEAGSVFAKMYVSSGTPYLTMYESAGGTDTFTINVSGNGSTNIGTIDAAGQGADLTLDIDGHIKMQTFGYGAGVAESSGEAITLNPGTSVIIDKDLSHTTAATIKALHVDLDRTGDVSSGTDSATGIDLDVNHTGASGGTIDSIGMDIDVSCDSGGTSTATGLMIDVGGADTCMGIHIDNRNGGVDFKNVSSASALDYFTINTIASGETTLKTNHSIGTAANINVEADGHISFSSVGGKFLAKKAGTEFSVANSAYAGMILGYTTVGIDASSDSYTLTDSMVVLDDAMKVKFVAPPSGVVEIFAQIYFDAARRHPVLGLSDADTTGYSAIDFPNANDVTNEHVQAVPPSSGGDHMLRPHWIVTGLTAGTAYEWWIAAKTSLATGGVLRWGGTATNQYPPFIMRATALPTAVTDYAVYG